MNRPSFTVVPSWSAAGTVPESRLRAAGQSAAVDRERAAGDEGGLVGAEPGGGSADLLRQPEAMDGHRRGDLVLDAGVQPADPLRQDGAGSYRVDADVGLRVVEGRRLRQAD